MNGNPFYFGKEVSGEAFTNRKQEIKELVSDIEQGLNIIIYSPRRYGKTSLIKKVLEITKKRGLLAFYLDLFPVTNISDYVKIYAQALTSAEPPSRIRKLVDLLGKIVPRLFPEVVLKPKGGIEISFDLERIFRKKELILEDLYEAPHRLSKKKKKKAVVVFDEFQEIAKLEEADKIEREMRTHFQKHAQVSYVFLGSKRHLMQEMFKNKSRPLYNCGRHFPLNKIKKEDFILYIQKRFLQTGYEIPPKQIEEILEITECHPYYTQLFCHILWDRCQDNKKIKAGDVRETLSELLREEEHNFSNIWDELSAVQRALVKAFAAEETIPLFSREFLIKYGIKSTSSIQKALRSLEKKEIIERSNGSRVVSDLFFKKWVMQL